VYGGKWVTLPGVPMTILNVAPITCAICKATFGELEGAACKQCRRILCRKHFFRGFFKGRGVLCSECVKKNSSASHWLKKFWEWFVLLGACVQKIFWFSSFFFRQFFRGSAPFPSYVRNLAQPAGAHLSDLDMEDVFGEWHDRAVFLAQCLAGSMKNSKSLAAARLDDFGRLFVLPKMARRFDNYGSRHVRPWFCGGLGFGYRTCWLKNRD